MGSFLYYWWKKKHNHIFSFQSFRLLQHWGQESWCTWFWSSGFWSPCSPAGDPRRFRVVSCDQEPKSWTKGGLLGLWPWVKIQYPAASPSWGRHSNLGQPPGQVPAEGPCTQHLVPEDWEPDLWGQWTLPGSSQLYWRIRTYPGFPPHRLW